MYDELPVTYEVSHDKPIHPDPEVASRFQESRNSTCDHGCKIYADPRSNVRVLHHNSNYGCRK